MPVIRGGWVVEYLVVTLSIGFRNIVIDINFIILDLYVLIVMELVRIHKNTSIKFLSFGVLVGAFSIFRRADTGNPVQI